jgi:hypothetical protein
MNDLTGAKVLIGERILLLMAKTNGFHKVVRASAVTP